MSSASASSSSAAPHPRRVWYRRLAHLWWRYQWAVIVALALLFLALGYVGFHLYYSRSAERPAGVSDLIYYATQLIPMISGGLQHPAPWELDVARHGLPLVVGYAGLAAIVVLLAEPLQRLRLRRIRGHVIVCGLGRKGLLLSRRFLELGHTVVAVEIDADNRAIERCRDEGVIVVTGDACDPPVLETAGAGRAAYVVAVCGPDGTNVDVAFAAKALAEKDRRRGARSLTCAAHIADPQLRELLQTRELETQDAGFRLELFSVFDSGAHAMLAEHPVLGDGAAATAPLVVVVGVGNFGGSLVAHAARDWLPHWRRDGRRLRVITIDRQAVARTNVLAIRYPLLDTVCELRAFDMDVASAEFQAGSFLEGDRETDNEAERGTGAEAVAGDSAEAGGRVGADARAGADDDLVVYVCLDQDSNALAASLTLLQRCRERRARIVVRLGAASGLAAFCDDTRHTDAPARLYGFPLLERTCTPDVVLGGVNDTLARAIHEEYRARRLAHSGGDPADPSLLPWEQLAPALIDANRHQADHIGVSLAAVRCCLAPLSDWEADRFTFAADEIERLARLEHQRWMDHYLAEGWCHAPGTKDPRRKTHPSLVPWEELPGPEREKDRETVRALPGFLARAGLQIQRLGPVPTGAHAEPLSARARTQPVPAGAGTRPLQGAAESSREPTMPMMEREP